MSAVGVVALLIALAALGLAGYAVALQRSPHVVPEPVPDVPVDVQALREEVAGLRLDSANALRHLAVVRYDAFGDMGGQLSWSLALLDDHANGVLLTSIHGRSDSRTYAKSIEGGSCEQQLSPEEADAVAHAQGRS